jgi:hypothetical protein
MIMGDAGAPPAIPVVTSSDMNPPVYEEVAAKSHPVEGTLEITPHRDVLNPTRLRDLYVDGELSVDAMIQLVPVVPAANTPTALPTLISITHSVLAVEATIISSLHPRTGAFTVNVLAYTAVVGLT